jgi:hypothetical protein
MSGILLRLGEFWNWFAVINVLTRVHGDKLSENKLSIIFYVWQFPRVATNAIIISVIGDLNLYMLLQFG